MAFMGMSGGIFETTFNNYLDDIFKLSADARGYLEFPRELPGFLVVLLTGLLCALPETRVAMAAALMTGAGMVGIALWPENWTVMLIMMTLWSVGTHLIMPLRSSIGMELAKEGAKGKRLGQISSAGIAASMLGCAVVYWATKWHGGIYHVLFAIGGGAALTGGLFFAFMKMPDAHLERPRFIFRKQYWLFYLLAFFFGVRKQIFLTFAPWVLIKVFKQDASVIALLWIASSVLGIGFQPFLGRFIDRFGERVVLMADSVLIFMVCAGYGSEHILGNGETALWIVYICFVGDQLLFGVNMARDTYLSKIVVKKGDIGPTLSMGITINHAVSMSLPSIGGLLWMKYGHASVFAATAGVAVLMFVFSSMIRVPKTSQDSTSA